MRLLPGTLQAGGAPFKTTQWTLVLQAGQVDSPEVAKQALEALCAAYWPPLYAYLRYRHYASTDAQDLVQAFFSDLIKRNALSRADQAKGRLRTFLLGSLQNFLINEHDRKTAQKRGGGCEFLSIDQHLGEAEAAMLAATSSDEESGYDLLWAAHVVTLAWNRLQEALSAEGKGEWLGALKPFLVGGTTPMPSQEDLAIRMGVPVATLRTWISRLRHRYRDALHAEVASTVSDPGEVEDELRYLYRLLTE